MSTDKTGGCHALSRMGECSSFCAKGEKCSITAEVLEELIKKALKKAFQLGQTYWYQADHESYSLNKKADVTRASFEALMAETVEELAAPIAPAVPEIVLNELKSKRDFARRLNEDRRLDAASYCAEIEMSLDAIIAMLEAAPKPEDRE